MTEIENAASVLDAERSSSQSARELAIARADAIAEVVLHQALAASGKTQREIARELDVSEGRVSQILSGRGSLKIATLARYLRALGYQLEIAARPLTDGLTILPRPRRNRNEGRGKIIVHARTHYGANSPSRQIMFSLDQAHDDEGWTPVGEVEDLRGTLAPLSGVGRAAAGARAFELNERVLQ